MPNLTDQLFNLTERLALDGFEKDLPVENSSNDLFCCPRLVGNKTYDPPSPSTDLTGELDVTAELSTILPIKGSIQKRTIATM